MTRIAMYTKMTLVQAADQARLALGPEAHSLEVAILATRFLGIAATCAKMEQARFDRTTNKDDTVRN